MNINLTGSLSITLANVKLAWYSWRLMLFFFQICIKWMLHEFNMINECQTNINLTGSFECIFDEYWAGLWFLKIEIFLVSDIYQMNIKWISGLKVTFANIKLVWYLVNLNIDSLYVWMELTAKRKNSISFNLIFMTYNWF